jgi:hypothetical protein
MMQQQWASVSQQTQGPFFRFLFEVLVPAQDMPEVLFIGSPRV